MNYENDIPRDLAVRAFNGTSWTPEKRGEQTISEYASILRGDYDALLKYAENDAEVALLAAEFARYRSGFAERYKSWLSTRSRCISSAITGPSNFPVRRAEKYNNWESGKWADLMEFRKRALDAIKKKLRPELRPIMSGDDNAVDRLKKKLEGAEKLQALMKAVNAAIRKNLKNGYEAQLAAVMAAGLDEAKARKILEPDYMGALGFAGWALTNNNADIRRMKDRLAKLERDKATPAAVVEGAAARVEDCPAENRVKLFFPGKPDEEVRAKLKSNGFRWAPTEGCWKAYRNSRTVPLAAEIAGLKAAAQTTAAA